MSICLFEKYRRNIKQTVEDSRCLQVALRQGCSWGWSVETVLEVVPLVTITPRDTGCQPLSFLPAMPLPVPCLLQHAGDSCSVNVMSLFFRSLLSSEDLPSIRRLCVCVRRALTPSFRRMSLGKLFCSFLDRGSCTPTGFSEFRAAALRQETAQMLR